MSEPLLVIFIIVVIITCFGGFLISGWSYRRRLRVLDEKWKRRLEQASPAELREMFTSLDCFDVEMPKGPLRESEAVRSLFETLDRDGPAVVLDSIDSWLTRLSQEEKLLGWDDRPMLMDSDAAIRTILEEMAKRS